MDVWSISPNSDRPNLMEVKDTPLGNVIFWSVYFAFGKEIFGLLSAVPAMSSNKMNQIEDQLH